MEDWFKKLFIDEAKPALERHTGNFTACDDGDHAVIDMFRASGEFQYMFAHHTKLTDIPQFTTTGAVDMSFMFSNCTSLQTIPQLDTSSVALMSFMFSNCTSLQTIPQLDMHSATNTRNMFDNCASLQTIPQLDMRNVVLASYMFGNCTELTECWIKNVKVSMQVGSGSSFGRLLTVESLIHLIKELRNTGSMQTMTIGDVNLEKLASVYVKTIEITDEMRAEDDLIDEKLPFEVCESTDEGAMLIKDYVFEKNWQIA